MEIQCDRPEKKRLYDRRAKRNDTGGSTWPKKRDNPKNIPTFDIQDDEIPGP